MGTLDRVYSQNGYIKRDGAPDSLPAELFRMDEKLCFHIGILSAFCTIVASEKRFVKHFRLFACKTERNVLYCLNSAPNYPIRLKTPKKCSFLPRKCVFSKN